MKKVVSSLITISLFVACTRTLYNSSGWQSKPVSVDGQLTEWPNPLRFYDQETGISYSISNDHNNLYFCCSISNEFLQTKILRAGLDFSIDTLGKKSFGVGIKYPIGNSADKNPGTENNPNARSDANGRSAGRSDFKLKLLAEAREMELVGFKSHLGKFISLSPSGKTGISAAINFDERGIMNYEAVIPFSTFYKNELTPSDSNTIFNYQIKINPDSRSNGERNGGNGTGGGGGGMHRGGMRGSGMGGGGMRGGGMRGGGMNDNRMSGRNSGNDYRRNSNSSGLTKTTIKLKLAYR
jgi:hypothetical protein